MVRQLFLQLIWITLPGRPLRRWKSRRIVKNNLDRNGRPHVKRNCPVQSNIFCKWCESFSRMSWRYLWDEDKTEREKQRAVLWAAAWRLLVTPDAVLSKIERFGLGVHQKFLNQKFSKPLSERGTSPSTLRKGRCPAARPNPAEIFEKDWNYCWLTSYDNQTFF